MGLQQIIIKFGCCQGVKGVRSGCAASRERVQQPGGTLGAAPRATLSRPGKTCKPRKAARESSTAALLLLQMKYGATWPTPDYQHLAGDRELFIKFPSRLVLLPPFWPFCAIIVCVNF